MRLSKRQICKWKYVHAFKPLLPEVWVATQTWVKIGSRWAEPYHPPPYPPIGEDLRRRRTGQTHEHINLWVFVVKYEDQELIWLKFHKFPRFNNSKGNRIVGGKLVRPAIHCRVCFWLAARVRLPTPVLKAFACWKTRSKSYWYNYSIMWHCLWHFHGYCDVTLSWYFMVIVM